MARRRIPAFSIVSFQGKAPFTSFRLAFLSSVDHNFLIQQNIVERGFPPPVNASVLSFLGHVPRLPPLLRFAHALQTAERRSERRVVDRAPEVEGLFEKTILLIVDPKRQFDDEGGSGGPHEAIIPHLNTVYALSPN